MGCSLLISKIFFQNVQTFAHLGLDLAIAGDVEHVEGGVDELDGGGEEGEQEAVVVIGDQTVLADHVEDAILGRTLVQSRLDQPLLGDLLVDAGPGPGVDGAVGGDRAVEVHRGHHHSLLAWTGILTLTRRSILGSDCKNG